MADTLRRFRSSTALCDDLISAFAQDVTRLRYDTWTAVLDYCRRSANPVGRLVLRICGYDDPRLERASDCVCTALQLTNFWQDLARDWAIGRLYLPEEEWRVAGARLETFDPAALTAEWRAALAGAAARTRGLFEEGRPVCDGVSGLLRWELRLTWLGGVRILERLEAADFDTVSHRPTLGLRDVPSLAAGALAWR
jgi:phytoene synthase